MKKFAGDIIIFHMCTKNHNHMMHGSWDTEEERQNFLSFWAIFVLSPPPNDPENENFEKKKTMNKLLWDIILLYINVYHKWRSYDIWFLKYKVPQTEMFVILGHFLPFWTPNNPENQNFKIGNSTWWYYHFTHLHHKWQSFDVWLLRYGKQQTEFFVIMDLFLPFYPPMDSENQNFLKWKKKKRRRKPPEDIIILQMCTINDNHIMYGSGDMECNGQNFLSFLTVFYSFTPLKKLKPFEKLKKKHLEISSFSTSLPKIMIICYTVLEIWCVMDVSVIFHFGLFFAFLPP